ncbi:hypothetical protein [Jiella marina]|uniref:hypothetical protein n=1 Tax=Jiella sp. LLJ827 TaxID=2917712 RepID=UPI0021016FAB|nr:hypothetical protein [Jiella sp. LLJ827]MCQ0990607.1 hypothetical protein [Jiella sp. LLJ827]
MDFDARDNEQVIRAGALFGLVIGGIGFLIGQTFTLPAVLQALALAVAVAVGVFVVIKLLVLFYDVMIFVLNGIADAISWAIGTIFRLFVGTVRMIVIDMPVIFFRTLAAFVIAIFSKDRPEDPSFTEDEPEAPRRPAWEANLDKREQQLMNIINDAAATEGEKANARDALQRYRARKGG